jgi:hypothetical protein
MQAAVVRQDPVFQLLLHGVVAKALVGTRRRIMTAVVVVAGMVVVRLLHKVQAQAAAVRIQISFLHLPDLMQQFPLLHTTPLLCVLTMQDKEDTATA